MHSFWAEKLEGLVLPSPQAPSRLPYLVSNMVLETNRGETVMQIVMIQGAVVGIASFTTGFVPRQCTPRRMSEDDVQATCLWFERHGQTEEAERLLQRWCQGIPCYCRR